MGRATITKPNDPDLRELVKELDTKVKLADMVLDGIEISIVDGVPTITYDDSDSTTHSGRVGNMLISITEDGTATIRQLTDEEVAEL